MSNLLLLDPAPLPEGLGIPAEDGHQTPTSVRQQCLALLKQIDALKTRLHWDGIVNLLKIATRRLCFEEI